jgi:hypothetical protein
VFLYTLGLLLVKEWALHSPKPINEPSCHTPLGSF